MCIIFDQAIPVLEIYHVEIIIQEHIVRCIFIYYRLLMVAKIGNKFRQVTS